MAKHVLVGDWASGDLTPEVERLGEVGISVTPSGIVNTDSIDERREKLRQAIASMPQIDAMMFCIAPSMPRSSACFPTVADCCSGTAPAWTTSTWKRPPSGWKRAPSPPWALKHKSVMKSMNVLIVTIKIRTK